ncbi:3-oxoacyl-[acyl-carrier-protein] synthase 2 [Planctomycetaceae bacterium]|nr:3-oxoacyl-[acyl-carrier-protein] synthase 2 [Planctomycetaceae bacterium]
MSAVITGLGVVSALGCGVEAFATGLASGQNACTMHEFTLFGGQKRAAPAYLAVPADAKGLIEPRKLRRMDRLIRMCAVSARQALRQASLDPSTFDASRLGVVFGTAFGALGTTQEFVDSWLKNGERHASPLAFMSSVHGIIASQIALDIGAVGVNLTLAQRDISFEASLATAVDLLEQGKADALLVGGGDELTGMLHEFASHFRYVERGSIAGADPWSKRGRIVPGDGAAVLLLEREGTPRKALARVERARVGRCDVQRGDAARALLAGFDKERVGLVTTSRAGSARSAPLESRRDAALDELLGRKCVKLSHRGSFGNFPTAGALQAVANVLMLQGQVFTPLAAGKPRADLVAGLKSPRCILHDAASVTGNHAAYVVSAI